MQNFEGRTAVVTGAASGIGRAVARRFASEGMNVVLADIETKALETTVGELRDVGHAVLGVPTDVSKWEQVQALAERARAHFGAVHVVHNNAGVVVSGPAHQLSLADYEWVLGVDLWSVIYGVKAFLPLIEAAGEGHIVNTASTAGLVASPHIAPYNIAKFGVVALSETVARELKLKRSPIGVSVLCPGAINTRIVESDRNRPADSAASHVETPEERRFRSGAGTLLATRGLEPAAVAGMVVDAIRAQQFWVLTHPDWKRVLQERVAALAADGHLTEGFGG
jgi:NAD(P)-dependent dehydrogenase (short-subunit alcohol dehydrogenase family)